MLAALAHGGGEDAVEPDRPRGHGREAQPALARQEPRHPAQHVEWQEQKLLSSCARSVSGLYALLLGHGGWHTFSPDFSRALLYTSEDLRELEEPEHQHELEPSREYVEEQHLQGGTIMPNPCELCYC